MGERKNTYTFWWDYLREEDHLENLLDGKTIQKPILKNQDKSMWTG
jgi:hypothetical protein